MLIVVAVAGAANDTRPVVGPGATKDDVVKAYGWPNGQSQSGTKEILSYAQGEVILENGKVERVNFSPDVTWQAPRPKPAPATASTRKLPEVPVDFWRTDFSGALAEAQKRHMRVLILFTGSDWSPASRQFHDELEYNPDFVNAFAGDFVFVKLDYPRGAPVPAKISAENLELRDRYKVTTYPTLLVLSPTGNVLAPVDLSSAGDPQTFRERVTAAVGRARDASAPGGVAAATAKAATATTQLVPRPDPVADSVRALNDTPATKPLRAAAKLIIGAIAVALVVIGFVLWRLWRHPQRGEMPIREMADRIDAAAGGMPLPAEMNAWSKEKLRAITAALAEHDGYGALVRPSGGDIDIELKKRGDVKPRVLVVCVAGSSGAVGPKRLRELFASLAAEGVENGWVVSPAGFVADARAYAAAHRIILIGSDGLHNLMREVPPVSLPTLLARG